MALTAKQALFVKEYLVDLNATGAALRSGYSEKTARSIASENLSKPDIQKAISKAQQKRIERVQWSADEILRDLKIIAEQGDNPLKERIKAYELGGKAAGMFTDNFNHTGSMVYINGESRLED